MAVGEGVDVVPVVGDVDVVPAAAGLAGTPVEVVWLLDVELLLLPQPATNPPPASAIRSHVDSFRIIGPPVCRK